MESETRANERSAWRPVWSLVRRIPRGRVMTYGQIASLLGGRLSPRAVGWALHAAPEGLPWHRVVAAGGRCSTDGRGDLPPGLQRALLEREGVPFTASGRIADLERRRFRPAARSTGQRRDARLTRSARAGSGACRP